MENAQLSTFKISNQGIILPHLLSDLEMRKTFLKQKCFHFPKIIDERLLTIIQAENDHAEFQDISNEEIGRELGTLNQETNRRMNFLVNNDLLFKFIENLGQLPSINCFTGRIIKMLADYDLDWHSDYYGHSVAGLSLNLSKTAFEGGEFQIRDKNTKEIFYSIHNVGIGDAIIFQLGEDLEHRLTPINGDQPRITFAGWFRTYPHYHQKEYQPLLQECLED